MDGKNEARSLYLKELRQKLQWSESPRQEIEQAKQRINQVNPFASLSNDPNQFLADLTVNGLLSPIDRLSLSKKELQEMNLESLLGLLELQ